MDFVVSYSGKMIDYFSKPGIPIESIRHLLLDQAIPRTLGQRGHLILHAAAVALQQGQAIAFVGASGTGKSTLASSFYQNGAHLITDDCLLLEELEEQILAIPNYNGARLFSDSSKAIFGDRFVHSPVAHYSTKSRIQLPNNMQTKPNLGFRLSKLFLLEGASEGNDRESVQISPIKGADELIAMIGQTFSLDITDKSLVACQFKNVGKLFSSEIEIYRLRYPRVHSMLPIVRASIEDFV